MLHNARNLARFGISSAAYKVDQWPALYVQLDPHEAFVVDKGWRCHRNYKILDFWEINGHRSKK